SGRRAVLSSSGSRPVSGSGPRSGDQGPVSDGAQARVTPSPTFELGATMEASKKSEPVLLARSEPGSAALVVEEQKPPPKGNTAKVFVAAAVVLFVVVGLVFARGGWKSSSSGAGGGRATATQRAPSIGTAAKSSAETFTAPVPSSAASPAASESNPTTEG